MAPHTPAGVGIYASAVAFAIFMWMHWFRKGSNEYALLQMKQLERVARLRTASPDPTAATELHAAEGTATSMATIVAPARAAAVDGAGAAPSFFAALGALQAATTWSTVASEAKAHMEAPGYQTLHEEDEMWLEETEASALTETSEDSARGFRPDLMHKRDPNKAHLEKMLQIDAAVQRFAIEAEEETAAKKLSRYQLRRSSTRTLLASESSIHDDAIAEEEADELAVQEALREMDAASRESQKAANQGATGPVPAALSASQAAATAPKAPILSSFLFDAAPAPPPAASNSSKPSAKPSPQNQKPSPPKHYSAPKALTPKGSPPKARNPTRATTSLFDAKSGSSPQAESTRPSRISMGLSASSESCSPPRSPPQGRTGRGARAAAAAAEEQAASRVARVEAAKADAERNSPPWWAKSNSPTRARSSSPSGVSPGWQAPSLPLVQALRARASDLESWHAFLDGAVDMPGVEHNRERRPQLRASEVMANAAVEKALNRWGVTVEACQAVGGRMLWSNGAGSDELLAFARQAAATAQEAEADPATATVTAVATTATAARSRSPPPTLPRHSILSTPARHARKVVPPPAGHSGKMRSVVARKFILGLAQLERAEQLRRLRGCNGGLARLAESWARCGTALLLDVRQPLYVVVEAVHPTKGHADLLFFEKASDAAAAATLVTAETQRVPVGGSELDFERKLSPFQRIKHLSSEDVLVLCDDWAAAPPRKTRPPPLSPERLAQLATSAAESSFGGFGDDSSKPAVRAMAIGRGRLGV